MSLGQCPEGYVELPVDKTRCRRPTGSAITVPKICPAGFTIDVSGLCLANVQATVEPSCPTGYFPIAGDTSNCSSSTSSTILKKVCPSGTTLQPNGLCGTGSTYPASGPTYCGPQYNGKDCKYRQQLTPGLTSATGIESTNMICAFQDGDTQFACDPGCCGPPTETATGTETETDTGSGTGTGTSSEETFSFPIWAIILLIVLGSLIFAMFLAWAAKKISRRSSNGG